MSTGRPSAFSMTVVIIIGLATLGTTACFHRPDHRGVAVVSIVDVLERPDDIGERTVEVGGVLELVGEPEFWGMYLLYLTSEHARARDRFTAVYVSINAGSEDLQLSTCLGRFVRVRGQLWKRPDGSYAIRDVTQVMPMPVGSEFDPPCWSAPPG